MLRSNYHTHLKYCNHAEGEAADYVAKAIDLGFKELGISDHAPVPEEYVDPRVYESSKTYRFMKLKDLDIYLNDCRQAREKFKDRIRVLIGLESEFIPERIEYYKMLRGKVDYLNLGAHYFLDSKGRFYNTYKDLSYKNINDYASTVIAGMESGLFNACVHPDLFFYGYKNERGEHIFDSRCEGVSRRIIESAIKNNVYLEINANGVFNSNNHGLFSYKEWLYPRYEFWTIASEYKNLKIIIGADAHLVKNLSGKHILECEELASHLGLKIDEVMELNH